jgi:hypothetical protein
VVHRSDECSMWPVRNAEVGALVGEGLVYTNVQGAKRVCRARAIWCFSLRTTRTEVGRQMVGGDCDGGPGEAVRAGSTHECTGDARKREADTTYDWARSLRRRERKADGAQTRRAPRAVGDASSIAGAARFARGQHDNRSFVERGHGKDDLMSA